MARSTLLMFIVFLLNNSFAQNSPWQSPLRICTGSNGITFGTSSLFQDSAGVASVIRIGSSSSDTLLCAFQWFPAPQGNPKWDRIAVKFSYDGGSSWTTPTKCIFIGLPGGYQRPFDPALVKLSNGQIRMYFSSSSTINPPAGGIDTYSGISNDGITYTIDPSVRFDSPTKHAIDPTLAFFGGTWYYNSWTSSNGDGAHRAISNDGLTFTTQAMNSYDGSHLWLGNYFVDGSLLKFYGCGSGMWVNASNDGSTWGTYTNVAVMGADPSVTKNKNGTYVMVYTGPPNSTGVKDPFDANAGFSVFPSEFDDFLMIENKEMKWDLHFELFDLNGKLVHETEIEKGALTTKVELSFLNAGVYSCILHSEEKIICKKVIKRS